MKTSNVLLIGILITFFYYHLFHPMLRDTWVTREQYNSQQELGAKTFNGDMYLYKKIPFPSGATFSNITVRGKSGNKKGLVASIRWVASHQTGLKVSGYYTDQISYKIKEASLFINIPENMSIAQPIIIYGPSPATIALEKLEDFEIVRSDFEKPLMIISTDNGGLFRQSRRLAGLVLNEVSTNGLTLNVTETSLSMQGNLNRHTTIQANLQNSIFSATALSSTELTIDADSTSKITFTRLSPEVQIASDINNQKHPLLSKIDHLILKGFPREVDLNNTKIARISGKVNPSTVISGTTTTMTGLIP